MSDNTKFLNDTIADIRNNITNGNGKLRLTVDYKGLSDIETHKLSVELCNHIKNNGYSCIMLHRGVSVHIYEIQEKAKQGIIFA